MLCRRSQRELMAGYGCRAYDDDVEPQPHPIVDHEPAGRKRRDDAAPAAPALQSAAARPQVHPVPSTRTRRRADRVAITDDDPEPHQAPPPPTRHRRALKRDLHNHQRPIRGAPPPASHRMAALDRHRPDLCATASRHCDRRAHAGGRDKAIVPLLSSRDRSGVTRVARGRCSWAIGQAGNSRP